jgi:thioredoxin 1
MTISYLEPAQAPTREQVDAMPGRVVLEFGTDWCGFCQANAPRLQALLGRHPDVRHLKVEDGSGRPLGRSFRVRLWPNLVFLRDGKPLKQLARPDQAQLEAAFAELCAE